MTSKTRNLLKWEFRWIPVEIAMTGLGLFLLQFTEAAAYFLFLAIAVSGTVRVVHYTQKQGSQQIKNVA